MLSEGRWTRCGAPTASHNISSDTLHTRYPSYFSENSSYPHRQVGPEVNDEDGDGLPPVVDGVDKVQTFFFLSVQQSQHSWSREAHVSPCRLWTHTHTPNPCLLTADARLVEGGAKSPQCRDHQEWAQQLRVVGT